MVLDSALRPQVEVNIDRCTVVEIIYVDVPMINHRTEMFTFTLIRQFSSHQHTKIANVYNSHVVNTRYYILICIIPEIRRYP